MLTILNNSGKATKESCVCNQCGTKLYTDDCFWIDGEWRCWLCVERDKLNKQYEIILAQGVNML